MTDDDKDAIFRRMEAVERRRLLADLRAKVEALPEDAVLYRGNILDLIAGISDD